VDAEKQEMTAVADTGYVVAIAVQTDQRHAACMAVHLQQEVIYLPQTTLAEVAYLLTRAGGNVATATFLISLPKSKYRVVSLLPEDIARTAELLLQYADSRIDFVDTTVVAVAERLNITRILTIDHRDFSIVRPRHCDYFELLPAQP
jgi:uncharacterized protein